MEKPNNDTIVGCFVDGEVICCGFAAGFKWLCDNYDIPSSCAWGHNKHEDGSIASHAWNFVCVDEEWYHFDPTWNLDAHPHENWFCVDDEHAMRMGHYVTDEPLNHKPCSSMRANLY